jgi:hypothetical protein
MTDFLNYKRSLTLEQVIDDELVNCFMATYDSFDTPYDAVKALIDYEKKLAIFFHEADKLAGPEPFDFGESNEQISS